MQALCAEAESIWSEIQHEPDCRLFVAADYAAVFQSLRRLRNRGVTFLEWGSGLGVVTIMASNLGFEAYGIEAESRLVEQSLELAEKYGPQAQFANGSFVPSHYQWKPRYEGENLHLICDGQAAYDQLDMELRDFDVVYAYPWPDEHHLYRDIMRQCGRQNSLLLTYDAHEGISLKRRTRRR
jgi:hypothetical protein